MGTLAYLTTTIEDFGECCVCGVRIAGPSGVHATAKRDKKNFHCINGHAQYFVGKTEEEKLREQLDAAKRDAERQRERVAMADRQASAARGQVTKIKNRVGNGVCPCCNRTFQNVMRHMQTKHPGYRHEDAT